LRANPAVLHSQQLFRLYYPASLSILPYTAAAIQLRRFLDGVVFGSRAVFGGCAGGGAFGGGAFGNFASCVPPEPIAEADASHKVANLPKADCSSSA